MNAALLSALAGETVIHANTIATVTSNALVVRDGYRGAQAVIGIETVTGVSRVTNTNPGFLVISVGLFTIAAASQASKQGMEVTLPIAFLAGLFVLGYFGTRRASLLFMMGNERFETVRGTYREAASIMKAVTQLQQPTSEPELKPSIKAA